jgi:hydroxymethylglutaryl-CoA reductase
MIMPCFNPDLFNGFSKLSATERFERLLEMGALTQQDIAYLQSGGVHQIGLGEKLIENVIGYFQLPLGVACHFKIDNKDYAIPMAVEETSIVAALSKSAKWIRNHGHISTEIEGNTCIGQLQIHQPNNFLQLEQRLREHKASLIQLCNDNVTAGLVRRGGGLKDILLRRVNEMAIIHIYVDCVDAMGANIINQALEFLKHPIEEISNECIDICILSNLNDSKVAIANVEINLADEILGQKIEKASLFAEQDPYRAATHNKGVLNGIDPILIATGNDWRAVEAGVHSYACRSGQYSSITKWRFEAGMLKGQFKAPITVGTVGGVTQLHPTAKMCLNMLGIKHADELSRVCAAVGLVQNLGALKALTTDGIIKGHMKLHIDNLVLNTDATPEETIPLKAHLESLLLKTKRISQANAHEFLSKIREKVLPAHVQG